MQNPKEIFREYLSDRGINASKQRNIILDQFIDLDRQLDVNELFIVLHTRNLKVRHATIYSAVKLFVKSGIAREIHLGDGVIRYERATEMGRHEAPRPLGRHHVRHNYRIGEKGPSHNFNAAFPKKCTQAGI